ncbi:helix-turn-helix transcriptional regulator [Streptococcus oralis]|uniref:HTH cro/C1-type domain-containing protein n=1 Tax=Streptococcus oralis subsp. dentisani TaxID=1458253 RepID=A0A1X1J328_STROR|nr:helix-turn-helix transcriptional regulator [Streptococcus oralis]MDU7138328.1 helix-turn-helix transcriptional regulator [Streptococcus mitis]ORO79791.1 hypothetical protein B7708_02390 [Streptococcus oralis subsp. dentisani]
MSTIKNRLKALRNAKGLTQNDLALELNSRLNSNEKTISKMTVSNWENNKHAIKQDKAELLAEFFNVSVPYLLGYEEEPLLEDIAQELSSYITKDEWEIIHSDPAQEEYYMSVAWDRMLEATRAPLNNVSDPILSTNVYKDIETETDLETLDSLISDTLLAKRILDSLQNRVLSSDIKNSQEYSQEIEKVISWLNDFSDALGSQKLQLIIKDNNP